MDVAYKCMKCEEDLSRERVRSDEVRIKSDRVNITDFVKDKLGAKVEIGVHKDCGGKVYLIAGQSVEGPPSNQPNR